MIRIAGIKGIILFAHNREWNNVSHADFTYLTVILVLMIIESIRTFDELLVENETLVIAFKAKNIFERWDAYTLP